MQTVHRGFFFSYYLAPEHVHTHIRNYIDVHTHTYTHTFPQLWYYCTYTPMRKFVQFASTRTNICTFIQTHALSHIYNVIECVLVHTGTHIFIIRVIIKLFCDVGQRQTLFLGFAF